MTRPSGVQLRLVTRALGSAGLAALAGCFNYVPVISPSPARWAEVQAELSTPASFALQDVTVHGIVAARGRVIYADQDSVVLAALRLWSQSGDSYLGEGVGITIPRSQLAAMREKRLSAGKTLLALGSGAALIAGVIVAVGPLAGSGRAGGSGGDEP